jgi:predicted RNase H-like HicB family nuclease
MKSYIFEVVIEEDKFEDGRKAYHAHCQALPGCHTSGHTYDEALANIKEAVELDVEDLRESGKPIPVDSAKGTVERPTPSVAVNLWPSFDAVSQHENS